LLAAGLEQIAEYLEALRFTPSDIEFLSGLKIFPADFLEYLSTMRFTGSVHAMAEGTPYFAHEPILRVTAPILEAQLVESRILNLAHFQSVIASEAVRCVLAARGGPMARKPHSTLPVPLIWRDLMPPRPSKPADASEFPCQERWPIPLLKRMTTRRRHFVISSRRGAAARRCSLIPMTPSAQRSASRSWPMN
jgi:hypothetical protein